MESLRVKRKLPGWFKTFKSFKPFKTIGTTGTVGTLMKGRPIELEPPVET
jgi:hypothetical protein